MKKDNLSNSESLRRIDRVRLKEKTKLVEVVIDSAQTSGIAEDNKLFMCGALVITQLLGIKGTILEKKN